MICGLSSRSLSFNLNVKLKTTRIGSCFIMQHLGALCSSKLQHFAISKKGRKKSRSEKTNDGGRRLKSKVVHVHNNNIIYTRRRRRWRRRRPKGMSAGATGQIDFGGTKMMWDHREVVYALARGARSARPPPPPPPLTTHNSLRG
uniref:Uncharacterized protein n=1 Tax=Schizaphis graminum TaxID=13262 RepID=A0A2S2NFI7_SCHGA